MTDQEREKEKKLEKNLIRARIVRLFLVLLIAALILVPFIAYIQINYQMHHVLRQAKNAKIAMRVIQIESYGEDASMYDNSRRDGLAVHIQEEIQKLARVDGTVTVLSWNRSDEQVTRFLYEEGRFRAIYEKNQEGKDSWRVDYIIPMATYESA